MPFNFNPLIPELSCADFEFLVMDPDGYALRFSQPLGTRPLLISLKP